MQIIQAVDRWLKWNDTSEQWSEELYDYELDLFLSRSDALFLLTFFKHLGEKKLTPEGRARLGAGLIENFIVQHPSSIRALMKVVEMSDVLIDSASMMWERDDMSEEALLFVRKFQKNDDGLDE